MRSFRDIEVVVGRPFGAVDGCFFFCQISPALLVRVTRENIRFLSSPFAPFSRRSRSSRSRSSLVSRSRSLGLA
jgi:hypothetical protein